MSAADADRAAADLQVEDAEGLRTLTRRLHSVARASGVVRLGAVGR